MKIRTMLLAIMMLAAALGWAQQPATTAAPPAQAVAPAQPASASSIPDGIIVTVEAKQTVETQKVKVGDPVKLEAIEDGKDADGKTVKGADGRPVIPRKTKFIAKVTSVKAGTKQSKDAKLSLNVFGAAFPNGKTMPFFGVVLGPFKVSSLSSGTGIDTRGGGAASKENLGLDTPQVPSGIEGVNIKIDPQLGTVLVAPNNFSLDNGTAFHVRYVDPAAHPAEPQPPKK